jgi:RimJ/RimL family protein N-acetyltransferase
MIDKISDTCNPGHTEICCYHLVVHIHLQTARLTIRRFVAKDEDDLVSIVPEQSRDYIRNEMIPGHLALYDQEPGFGVWAADNRATGAFMGWFVFRPRKSDGMPELGYLLRQSSWGNGYATEGSLALIDKGFSEKSIDRVVAESTSVNLASRRVMEKCGMLYVRTHFAQQWNPNAPGNQSEVEVMEYEITRANWEKASQG